MSERSGAPGAHTVTVTAATGKTGREVVRQAALRGWRVRPAARRPPEQGGWVRLDWDDPSTWEPAFAGSDAAYVIVPFTAPGVAERTPDLLAAANAAGVGTLVLLSSMDAADAPRGSPLRAAEEAVAVAAPRWAVLRPTWFLDNFVTGRFAEMTAAGALRLPAGDGTVPFIDVRDVAAVAVAALAPDGCSGVLPLTGPEQLDHHDVAAALSAVRGGPVRYVSVPPGEFVERLLAEGFERDYAEFLATALADVAEGRLRIPVADTVERATGRPPRSLADFARHHAGALAERAAEEPDGTAG
jgi:uncharacterized protein YbjT (DUF2867 family)